MIVIALKFKNVFLCIVLEIYIYIYRAICNRYCYNKYYCVFTWNNININFIFDNNICLFDYI